MPSGAGSTPPIYPGHLGKARTSGVALNSWLFLASHSCIFPALEPGDSEEVFDGPFFGFPNWLYVEWDFPIDSWHDDRSAR